MFPVQVDGEGAEIDAFQFQRFCCDRYGLFLKVDLDLFKFLMKREQVRIDFLGGRLCGSVHGWSQRIVRLRKLFAQPGDCRS